MHHLVYASSATQLLQKPELIELLEKSRRNNIRLGVSGLLLYQGGKIMQVLEGEKPVIETLFERIKADTRHVDVVVLLNSPIADRSFPDWSMGFRDLDDTQVREMPGYSEFMNVPLSAIKDQTRALKLLKLFKAMM